MQNANSAIAETPVDWSVDNRGYIHGGFDTPIFGKVKHNHNSRLTRRKNKIKKSSQYGRQLIQPVAVFGNPGFNRPESHPIKENN
jgi:hypothetical protein